MWLFKVTLIYVLVVSSCYSSKNNSEKKTLCGLCLKTENTSCIAQNCEYKYESEVAVSGTHHKAKGSLAPPKIHCQDESLLVLVWEAVNGTTYFLEYFTNNRNRYYTDLTTNGYKIIEGLRTSTAYFIQLTSFMVANYVVITLQRSPQILVTTLKQGRPPLPVPRVYLHSLNLVNYSYTALVRWDQAADKSCFYNIFWYGGEDIGEYSHKDITDPLSAYEVNITDLQFRQNYSLAVRAINGINFLRESSQTWVHISIPTCLETFKSLLHCTPEIPENFGVQEIFRHVNHMNIPLYDIKMSWSKPNYTPDFYRAHLINYVNEANIQMNITGNRTSAEYTNIELGGYYEIYLIAYSEKGPSPAATLHRFVNGTMTLHINESWLSTEIILLIVFPFIIIGFVFLLAINHFILKKSRCNTFEELEKKAPTVNYIVTSTDILEETDKWELEPEKLIMKDILGEGAFGIVKRGYYYRDENNFEVAIKMLKEHPSQDDLKQFYQEIEIMKTVPPHPHLVSLIGCIIKGTNKRPLLVVEYCAKGDLETYLRNAFNKLTNLSNNKVVSSTDLRDSPKFVSNKLYDLFILDDNDIPKPKDLISYARQIALGMEYLTSLKLIHRDLAARNVLICENNTVKISDFGLSRDVYQNKIYCKTTGGKLPIRWMALESMTHQVYTSQSDVWSFGILLWEIVTLGSTPYPGVSTADLLPLLKEGYRMEKPNNCSGELYSVMYKCWKTAPKERPTFFELRKTLDDLLESVSNYLNLNIRQSDNSLTYTMNNKNKYKNDKFCESYILQIK